MTASHAFLSRLSEAAVAELAQRWTLRSYQAQELIIAHGESGRDVFFVVEGRARAILFAENGREVAYNDIGPGDIFGELAGIDGRTRYFHAYCDLAQPRSPVEMRDAIVDRESWPVKAMTRAERLEHVWSATHDEYRGYAGERFLPEHRGKRTILVYGLGTTELKLLDDLSDDEIAAKLPVHLRHLPILAAA